ncbi:MAG: tRNA (adenosine(37)-N6)-threonylcarbamoyltransferase complex dimerization subunit type 1 TsaB [Gemmataceae bacterium]|nr:tRNA (adenosine(37)-N6)-threonylcarbamoyltransferase complex dimerization subunit type 1 TsaB [Gemmataceae bacterium]
MMPRLLLIETSHRRGWVALAQGERVLGMRHLEESRRHARDLVPLAKELLDEQGWKPRDLEGVVVDRGPGSYTGLRVGIISAKTLAYAVGCPLVAYDAFDAIAEQSPNASTIDVIADAQQEKVYVQRFRRDGESVKAVTELAIIPVAEWMMRLQVGQTVSGPGLELFRERLPSSVVVAPEDAWTPLPATALRLALARLQRGERDDPFSLEPLYLRPSSAEENWKK